MNLKQTDENEHLAFYSAPSLAAGICFCFFWLYRSQHIAGDGGLIGRITEGGKWIVKNELFSQAVLQLVYRILAPWHFSAFEAMNILSCLCGAIAVWLLIVYTQRLYRLPLLWPLLLFFSSGFQIYCFGHTEYYPIFLPFMLIYGFEGVKYLRGQSSITPVSLLFVLAAGFHFAMLIALPSLLLLPWLKEQKQDYRRMAEILLLLAPLFVLRNFPQWLGYKAAGLSPAWNALPLFPEKGMIRLYAFFDWRHVCDWIYAWAMRSWIYWPAILYAASVWGWQSLIMPERLFLLIYTLCLTLWTTFWHPDLGILADWDLFALEAAPCLLLLLSYMEELIRRPFTRYALIVVCAASAAVYFSDVRQRADLPRMGFGAVELRVSEPNARFVLDGFSRPAQVPRIRQGKYSAKWIDAQNREVHDSWVSVSPGETTVVELDD